MVFNAQAGQVSGSSPTNTSKSKSNGGVSQPDFKGFLKNNIDRLLDLSVSMADDNKALNLPEYGMYNINGADKMKIGTMFALGNLVSQLDNAFQQTLDLYMESLKLLYDQPTQLLRG
jgi:hypothetical protein